jgi:hypothetical protein
MVFNRQLQLLLHYRVGYSSNDRRMALDTSAQIIGRLGLEDLVVGLGLDLQELHGSK